MVVDPIELWSLVDSKLLVAMVEAEVVWLVLIVLFEVVKKYVINVVVATEELLAAVVELVLVVVVVMPVVDVVLVVVEVVVVGIAKKYLSILTRGHTADTYLK